jgi:hypothetical protein
MKKLFAMLVLFASITFVGFGPSEAGQSGPSKLPVDKEILYSHYRIRATDGIIQIAGTGIGIGEHDVLTAGHMVLEDENAKYTLDVFDPNWLPIDSIELVLVKSLSDWRENPRHDLALFRSATPLPYHIKLKFAEAEEDEYAYAIGASFGEESYHVTIGLVFNKDFEIIPGMVLTGVLVAPGNSGGGCFSLKDNKFLGVVVMGSGAQSLLVPAKDVKEFLK